MRVGLSRRTGSPTGPAINMTGYTATFRVWDAAGTQIVSLTIGAGLTLDAVNGRVQVDLTPTQTRAIAAADYTFEYRWVDPAGRAGFPVVGVFTVEPRRSPL